MTLKFVTKSGEVIHFKVFSYNYYYRQFSWESQKFRCLLRCLKNADSVLNPFGDLLSKNESIKHGALLSRKLAIADLKKTVTYLNMKGKWEE